MAGQFVFVVVTEESSDNVYVFEDEADAEAFASACDCESRVAPTVIVSEQPVFAHGSAATREVIETRGGAGE